MNCRLIPPVVLVAQSSPKGPQDFRRAPVVIAVLMVAVIAIVGCSADEPGTNLEESPDTGLVSDTGGGLDAAPDEPDTNQGLDAQGERDVSTDTDVSQPPDGSDASEQGDADTTHDTGESLLEGDSCETAIDVTQGGVWEGESTLEMRDLYDPSMASEHDCVGTNFSDRDRVYMVSPEETTHYGVSVQTVSPDWETMIFVRQDCDADACRGGTMLSAMTFEAPGGEPTYIIVAGQIGHAGDYDLEVTIEES